MARTVIKTSKFYYCQPICCCSATSRLA